jgi:iron transport multicopper oxidase
LILSEILFCLLEKNRTFNAIFRIRWFNASPDTYQRPVLSINGEIPAPTIVVEQGDIINITLINESSEVTAIHWHGLLQRNTLHMDGVPGITQCAILPNHSFIYTYSTNDQSGTYWYHSHFAIQYGDGLKGVLIIKDRNDPWKNFYQDEEILQITDWYHTPVHILLKSYLYPGTSDPIPDTGLINGIGQFNCSLNRRCSYYRASIRAGKTKRFRIINTSVYARITLTIDQHQMRLIEADGINLDGNKYVTNIRLSPGQRYSVLITGKLNFSRSYWIRATIHPFVDYNDKYNSSIQPNVSAILQYTTEHQDMFIS